MDYSIKCKSHPWHGINPGTPDEVRAFIEIVPTDTVKYEVDKESGYLSTEILQHSSFALRVHSPHLVQCEDG